MNTHLSSSSMIKKLQHNAETQQLHVHMRTGDEYIYEGVDEATYRDFCDSPSHGRYFNISIKGQFKGSKQ